MIATSRPRVKICCIGSIEEAALAVRYGASALGLVGRMPSGPGPIDDERIAAIARATPPGVSTFLLTCEQRVSEIIAHHRRCHNSTLQLVDEMTEGEYAQLREALPSVKIVQVIHVSGDESIDDAAVRAAERGADAILLDSGAPKLAIKELGGTGRTHDWSISRRIREALDVPVYLAGGLRPDNVIAALDAVEPFGLDVCSGLRTDERLDEAKLAAFMEAVDAWTSRRIGVAQIHPPP